MTLFSATLLTWRIRSGIGMISTYLRNAPTRLTRCAYGDFKEAAVRRRTRRAECPHSRQGPDRALAVLVLVVAAVITAAILQDDTTVVALEVAVVAVPVVVIWVVIPFLRWMTSTYTVTNRRLITRHGIITRTGRDIPLFRINDVAYEKGLLDRILGCGTLIISDATEKAGVVLPDVPNIEQVHLQITDLLFARDDGNDDDGSRVPGEPPRNQR